MSQRSKAKAHWLLRILSEDSFLRFYAGPDRDRVITHAELEHALWALPLDLGDGDGDGDDSRRAVWGDLERQLPPNPRPHHIFRAAHQRIICSRLQIIHRPHIRALGLDFLFPSPESNRLSSDIDENLRLALAFLIPPHEQPGEAEAREPQAPPEGLVELHAHFRGSVPIEIIWRELMRDARLRANHRSSRIAVGTWRCTRAELLEQASKYEISPREGPSPLRGPDASHEAIALLAICANFRRHLLYQRGTVGLTSFTKAYDRYSKASKPSGRRVEGDIKQTCAVLTEMARRGVHGVELRPTFEPTRIELQRKLRPLVLGYLEFLRAHPESTLTFGLVPSLFKQHGVLRREPLCNEDSPDGWVRRQSAQWRAQVEALLEILRVVPALRLFVVGIDAAGREQGCPVRSLAAAYQAAHAHNDAHGVSAHTPGRRMGRWLRELRGCLANHQDSNDAWDEINNDWGRRIRPIRLGLTVHVGEDFIDPVSGLREIWEAIDHLGLRRGDRLGHALAAGLNCERLEALLNGRAARLNCRFSEKPARSADERARVRLIKPLGVHLLDVAWRDTRLGRDHDAMLGAAGRAASGTRDTSGLLRDLHGSGPEVSLRLPGVHFWEAEQVPRELLTTVLVDEGYKADYRQLRWRVLERIQERGLIIESCPTSNITVAGLDRPPIHTFLAENTRVTVASDDPAIFGAWLDDEVREHVPKKHHARVIAQMRAASFL